MDRTGRGAAAGAEDTEKDRLSTELAEARDQVRQLSDLLEASEHTRRASSAELDDLAKRLRFAEEQARELAAQLEETRGAPAWRLLQRLLNHRVIRGPWSLTKRAFPTWLRQEVKARVRGRGGETFSEAAALDELDGFLSRVDQAQAEQLVVLVAGAKLRETEGQRATQLAHAFIRQGLPVLFIYHRWRSEYHQAVPKTSDPNFHQAPMDLFDRHRGRLLERSFRPSLRRTCIFELPHPRAAAWVRDFKSAGWITVYDVIDDWEEFHKAGKLLWYRPSAERDILASCDAVTAVSPALVEKLRRRDPKLVARLVPNGVSLESFDLDREAHPLRRGQVTVGYFGFLTPAWFDWALVAETARRRPGWEFHIIGFGEPAPDDLPKNVQMLGRVPHYQLAGYAKNWDVAMVPFKRNVLSRNADPIKAYEYLALGLPVVATGVPHLGDYPGVHVAESVEEFERSLERAAAEPLDRAAVSAFLAGCAWSERAGALLEAGRNARGTRSG